MLAERFLGEVLRELYRGGKTGALYIDVVEQSEDMIRFFFENGEIYFVRYGTAIGNEVLEIIEYYHLYSATFVQDIMAPGKPARNLPPTKTIIDKLDQLQKKIKVR
jgi:hypothetical protein